MVKIVEDYNKIMSVNKARSSKKAIWGYLVTFHKINNKRIFLHIFFTIKASSKILFNIIYS